ncbi:hypothetical protein PR001_g8934 [Phytophthora rubi]|uniref:Uncharacterized protein n=1 Tax=Phytophthora rubi TaxID=129364 RepID=A0A6A3KNH0_9STRA|nr:hypothetical protein PR002_g16784 [Phytophthora rubi]KAE9036218.1 hypothetical protein PR001_g8934 [Phytophthora rubi]
MRPAPTSSRGRHHHDDPSLGNEEVATSSSSATFDPCLPPRRGLRPPNHRPGPSPQRWLPLRQPHQAASPWKTLPTNRAPCPPVLTPTPPVIEDDGDDALDLGSNSSSADGDSATADDAYDALGPTAECDRPRPGQDRRAGHRPGRAKTSGSCCTGHRCKRVGLRHRAIEAAAIARLVTSLPTTPAPPTRRRSAPQPTGLASGGRQATPRDSEPRQPPPLRWTWMEAGALAATI